MNERQKIKFEMYQQVQGYLDDQGPAWNTIPIQAALKAELDDLIHAIKDKITEQAGVIFGSGKDKAALKENIANRAAALADTINAFATITHRADLANATGTSYSAIFSNTHTGFVANVDIILLLAKEHAAALKDYGISKAMVNDLETSLEDFEEISGKPRATTVRHSVTVTEITDLVKTASDLLNSKLDKLMSRYQLTNSPFFEGYKRARIIVD